LVRFHCWPGVTAPWNASIPISTTIIMTEVCMFARRNASLKS